MKACHTCLPARDTLVVPDLAGIGRFSGDLITMVGDLRGRDIGFTSLHEKLDTTTPGGRAVVRRAHRGLVAANEARTGPQLDVRRFICREVSCDRTIFTELVDGQSQRRARRSKAVRRCPPGSGWFTLVGVPVSPSTLLRMLRASADPVIGQIARNRPYRT